MNWEIITFIAYFAILLGVALVFYFNGTNKNSEDFFLGGRSMGPWVTALSAQASDMSAWLLMGLPGSILAFGFGQMWIGIGLALGTAANWILCAKRLRTFSKAADDAITVSDKSFCNRLQITAVDMCTDLPVCIYHLCSICTGSRYFRIYNFVPNSFS